MAGRNGSDSTDGHVENSRRPGARRRHERGGCATSDQSAGPMIQIGAPPPPPLAPPPPPIIAPAPKPYIYPNRGQTAQQEQFDRGQCYSWAVQQSGFDPANPQVATTPPPAPGAPQGGLFRGAAGGAALGAVGGAIGGNAGEGAAIGAAVGGLFGMMRRAEWSDQQQQQQANYAAAAAVGPEPGPRELQPRVRRLHGRPRLHGVLRDARADDHAVFPISPEDEQTSSSSWVTGNDPVRRGSVTGLFVGECT